MREKSGSRSPRRDVRDGSLTRPDVRDRRVSFEDERGRPLAHQIPAASTGRFKALRNSVPRRDGESRRPLEKQNDDTAGTGGASQGKVDVFLSQSASMLAAEVNEGWPTVCPVLAGAPVPVSPREWEKGYGRGRVTSSCSVHAERTGGKADVVAQEKPLSPAAKGGWMKQSSEMPLDASGSGGEFLGCEPKGTPSVSESFATIFQINKLRSLSFEALLQSC